MLDFEPAVGTVVTPGQTVQLYFDIQGSSPQQGAVFSLDGNLFDVEGVPPYVLDYTVPDYKAGKIKISVQTINTVGKDAYGVETYLIAQSPEPLTSMSVFPHALTLTSPGEMYPLQVTGTFSGNSPLDITSSDAGTTYTTKSNTESVLSVTADGIVEAIGNGQDTVIISNSGHTATVKVNVAILN
jgi:hypothetical protein